jgi:hypothetical protein
MDIATKMTRMSDIIEIAQFGLGPIGIESLKLAATKPWARVVGAVDIDPTKAGKDLGELTQIPGLKGTSVHRSIEDLLKHARPDVVLHTTVSKFKDAFGQLEPLARLGISVVSSCEELLFPQLKEPALAARLDQICRENGARVVGTGVNPGFVMDVLPLCLTGVSRDVRGVRVERVVNASTRRAPLQKKIGSGLAPEEFRRLFQEGRAGHAGLKESAALIAHCLSWKAEKITETGDAVIADHDIRTQYLEVRKGLTCGLHQLAKVEASGKVCVTLDIKMYLDAKEPHDAIWIDGEPPLEVVVKGGVAGDHATVAALVNTAARILSAKSGLLLMSDLSLPRWA